MADYPPPIDALLTLGDKDLRDVWRDYLGMGLGPEHVPDLIRMASDPELNEADTDASRVWAPLHAWRALGQIGGESAIEPLIDLMDFMEERDDDYYLGEVPEVMGMIGPAAIGPLKRVLADETKAEYVRVAATNSLEKIAQAHPESRAECVEILTHQLALKDPRVATLNGFIVSDLVSLDAEESAPVLEEAFAAECVDESVQGDWDYVRYDLGLGPKPQEHRYPGVLNPFFDPAPRQSRPDPKRLVRRHTQKQARKQQRARSKKHKKR